MKPIFWEFVRAENGTFEIFYKGILVRGSIPDRWLADELAKYGFCGEEYADIRCQIDESGRAKIQTG